MPFLGPSDDLDVLAKGHTIFAIETRARIFLLARRTLVLGAILEEPELGVIVAHGCTGDEADGVGWKTFNHLFSDVKDVVATIDTMLDPWESLC